MTIEEALGLARGHLQAGRLADVEAVCRAVLAAAPRTAEAYRLLGSVAYYAGKQAEAESLIRQALALNPGMAEYHENLSVVLFSLRRLGEAEAAARQALAAESGLRRGGGSAGQCTPRTGTHGGGGPGLRARPGSCGRATPTPSTTWRTVLLALGRPREAEAAYRRALAIKPDLVRAVYNLGVALQAQGRYEEAIAAFRRALAAEPRLAGAEIYLGNTYQALGQREEAVAAYRRALAIVPQSRRGREQPGRPARVARPARRGGGGRPAGAGDPAQAGRGRLHPGQHAPCPGTGGGSHGAVPLRPRDQAEPAAAGA